MFLSIQSRAPLCHTTLYFGSYLSAQLVTLCAQLSRHLVIISDAKVAALYGLTLQRYLKEKGLLTELLTFPPGDLHKTRATKEALEDALLSAHYGRDTGLIALGGGVTTDLVGFLAATYMRGVPYLSIPTSLMGMVDASLGGKTGVNSPWGKNHLGAFYPPRAVFLDPSFLTSLSPFDFRQGLAEVIKYALIDDASLFDLLTACAQELRQKKGALLTYLIQTSCQIKKKIVESDMTDRHRRHVLNFGHTIGHALEQVENYQLAHGEAVAIGLLTESWISATLGRLSLHEFGRIRELLLRVGFSLSFSCFPTVKALRCALQGDKKSARGAPFFITLDAIGAVSPHGGRYGTPIEDALLNEALHWMLANMSKNKEFSTYALYD